MPFLMFFYTTSYLLDFWTKKFTSKSIDFSRNNSIHWSICQILQMISVYISLFILVSKDIFNFGLRNYQVTIFVRLPNKEFFTIYQRFKKAS